jgi:hypothetical protein
MLKNNFATGQCLCGEVQYTIFSDPLRMAQCHCDDCKKVSGAGHVSNAFFVNHGVQSWGQPA